MIAKKSHVDPTAPESPDPRAQSGAAAFAVAPPEPVREVAAEPEPLGEAELTACIEAVLFASGEPIPRRRLRDLFPEVSARDVDGALLRLEGELIAGGRSFSVVEDAAGVRLLTRAEYAPYVARLRGEKREVRLSQAAFETLAVIAYRQPMRRADLEAVRGVQCGAVLKNLMEWNLVRVVGRDESLGRPLLYGTADAFLEQFGLATLEDLPEPERLRDLAAAGLVNTGAGDAAENDMPLFNLDGGNGTVDAGRGTQAPRPGATAAVLPPSGD